MGYWNDLKGEQIQEMIPDFREQSDLVREIFKYLAVLEELKKIKQKIESMKVLQTCVFSSWALEGLSKVQNKQESLGKYISTKSLSPPNVVDSEPHYMCGTVSQDILHTLLN